MTDLTTTLRRRHLRIGWWTLTLFATLGVGLELLHGFKLPIYLDVANSTRRLMWTLSHAHGTLLAVLHFCFSYTVGQLENARSRPLTIAGASLSAATVLIPLGFLLGGLFIHGGDPGLGVALVAPGGVLLVGAAAVVARETGTR